MITTQPMFSPALTDADLVQRSLREGSGAFSEIVARYQNLVCSLTYNATGSLSRSEDLAQEVFLAAWKELRQLREPEKLRPWLCGIARRLAANAHRRDGREPVSGAVELEDEHHAAGPGPAEQTISREEETILWRSLEQIPENYREPLILFYREGQSVERVAAALELTEDAAKQRLSRGRKLLQEQVALFVEGALRQSTPGRAFTLGVLAALPLLTASASAATIGTAAAKSGVTLAGIGLLGLLGAILGPIVGCLGAWIGVQASLETATSEKERQLIRYHTKWMIIFIVLFTSFMVGAIRFQRFLWSNETMASIVLNALLPVTYLIGLTILMLRFRKERAQLVAQEAPQQSAEAARRRAAAWKTYEYKSAASFLGLPLVHIRTGCRSGEKVRPALGWVAIGDVSVGILVSIGGISIGGLSIGGCSLGLISIGGVACGGLAMAGVALGWAATGGLAIGYLAHGGCAIAWHAAQGGTAIAWDFALGASAHARHANDAVAQKAIEAISFFHRAQAMLSHPLWVSLAWIPLLLIPLRGIRARRALRKADGR